MKMMTSRRTRFARRSVSVLIIFTFVFTSVLPPAYAQSIASLNLPVPGAMVTPSAAFVPVLLKGMTIHPDNPLQFDFIIDSGNTNFKEDQIKTESQRLVKYFLASMTIPKDDLWVNLSPYESDKIIPEALGKTELGRDMLAQDYILKQLTASLMYPEKELGKEFWNKVYKQAQERFGTTEIPVNTFNKVWILPETATVYEHGQTVYIVEARLKVMLDSDYLAMNSNVGAPLVGARAKAGTSPAPTGNNISTSIIREIILPEIEHEVNYGQNFAPLRQIYHSLILAKWYKETIKNSLLSKVYVDKKLINGIRLEDGQLKGEDGSIIDSQSSIVDQIYNQYMAAYKKGVFNYIKEDYNQLSTDPIPRKYFSGGEVFVNPPLKRIKSSSPATKNTELIVGKNLQLVKMNMAPQKQGASSPIFAEWRAQRHINILFDAKKSFEKRKRSSNILAKLDTQDAITITTLIKRLRERMPQGKHYKVEDKVIELLPDARKFQNEGYDFKILYQKEKGELKPKEVPGYDPAVGGYWGDGAQGSNSPSSWGSTVYSTNGPIYEGEEWVVDVPEKIEIVRSTLSYAEARALVKRKLVEKYPNHPEYVNLIQDKHAQQVVENDGKIHVVYHEEKGHWTPQYPPPMIRESGSMEGWYDENDLPQEWFVDEPAHIEIIPSISPIEAQERLQSTVNFLKKQRVTAGLHTVTGQRTYADALNDPARGEAFIADIATMLANNKITPVLDNLAVLKKARINNPDAYLGYFTNNNWSETQAAVEAGANILIAIEALSREQIQKIKTEYPGVALIALIKSDTQNINDQIQIAIENGVDGIQFAPFKNFTNETFEQTGEAIKALRSAHPDLIISGAGGIFENRIKEVLLMPEHITAAIGFNAQDRDAFTAQVQSYKNIIDPIVRSSSPVFMEEMKQRAAELGIPLGERTKIAVFIGGKQILSGNYYEMFKEVVRGNFEFDLVYLPFVVEEGTVDSEARIQLIKDQLAHNPRVVGGVISGPWKERFFEPEDQGPGAINYIVKDKNGGLRRMATDGETWLDGLKEDLDDSYDFQNKKIVILGSGGSARELADTLNGKLQGTEAKITFTDTVESKRTSLKEALDQLNPSYRTAFLAPDDLPNLRQAIREADILINATGVGRAETAGQSPLLPHLFAEAKHDLIIIDLISNTDTQMLKDAREIGPEGIKTFNGRSMYIHGMVRFIKGWMAQAKEGGQVIPSDDELYQAITQSELSPKEIFQTVWPRFGYNERYYPNMGEIISQIASLREEGKISKTAQYDVALKAAIAFTGTKVVPDVYVVDSGEESFGAEWIDATFGPSSLDKGVYIERSLLDTIEARGDPADMLVRVFVHVLTAGSIVKKRKAQFEYAKAKFPRLVHHLLDPVNGGTKNIEQVLWDVRDNVLGLATAEQIQDYIGDIGVPYTIAPLLKEKQQEIKRHAEELADIAESALHKIALNALNKTIALSLYQRMHLKEHEMTSEDKFSVGMLAYAANPPTFAHALVAALKAMAESNSDIFFVSATFADFRKAWLRMTYEKRQDISTDFFWMLSGGLIRVMPRIPHDDGFNGEEKVLPILDMLDGAGAVKLWYGAGDDHYFAFAIDQTSGQVKFAKIVKEGDKKNYNDFEYYVKLPGYQELVKQLLILNEQEFRIHQKFLISQEYLSALQAIAEAQNPIDLLQEGKFFPVLDTIGKLWLIQKEINHRKNSGQYSTDFTLGMINVLRQGVQKDELRDSLDFPTTYNPGASFDIAATYLRNGVAKLIKEKKIDLVAFEAMSKNLLKQLLSPAPESREYLYSLVRLGEGLIAAKAVQTLFPVNEQKENARHQKLKDKLQADLSLVVPDAVVDERSEGDISKITVSDAGRMNDLIEYTYSVHNGLYPDGRGKEIVLVVNVRSKEDMPAQLKDAVIKAIKNYVWAYNYAEGFREIQDTLIKDLVRRDKNKSELSSADADVIMIASNDDLNVYQEALDLIGRGIGKHLLISGGMGRFRDAIQKAAADAGFVNIEKLTEAQMIRNIMTQMAEKAQRPDLVEKLNDDNFVILENKAAFTVQSFSFAKQKLIDKGFLGNGQKSILKLLYMHKPLQQLRAKGNFNSVFFPKSQSKEIAGISYTTDYSKNSNTPSDIVAEFFRIIANHQKKRKAGERELGDWEIEGGLKSVPASHWVYVLLLFNGLTQEEKRKLVDTLYTNIENMEIDDRTVLYKNLSVAAKPLAEAIYAYGQSSPSTKLGASGEQGRTISSPVIDQGTGNRVQGTGLFASDDKVGGIDMNSIDIGRLPAGRQAGVDIQFDPAELREIIDAGIDGFAPVIINITPLPSVLPLLGLQPAKEEEALEVSRLN